MAQTNVQVFSGNVGIGTTGPAGKLHVETPLGTSTNFVKIGSSLNSGSSQSVSGIEFAGNPAFFNGDNTQRSAAQITSGFYEGGTADWADAYISLRTPNDPANGTLNDILTIRGGNIGINTTGPAYPLHVMSDTVPQVWIEGAVNTDAVIQSGSGPSYRNTYHRIRFKHYALPGDAFKASNSINFEVSPGGLTPVSAMTINGWGRVGIGTTTPACTLDVRGSGQYEGIYSKRIWVASIGDNTGDGNPDDNTGSPWRGLGFDDLAWNDTAHRYSGDIPILSGYNGVALRSGAGNLVLTTAGNVGIGTTLGRSKLYISHVNGPDYGASIANDRIRVMNRIGGGQFDKNEYGFQLAISGSGNSAIQTVGWVESTSTLAAGYHLLLQPNGGNVGIGTLSPGNLLDLYRNTSNGASIRLKSSGSGEVTITKKSSNSADQSLQFTNYPATGVNASYQFLTWNGSGWNYPLAMMGDGRLTMNGAGITHTKNGVLTLYSTNVGNLVDQFVFKASTDTNVIGWFLNAAGTSRGSIGGVNASSIVYNTTSDERLKKQIKPMQTTLDRVNALKPCTYTWIRDEAKGYGFVAQEVYKVFPEMKPVVPYSGCTCKCGEKKCESCTLCDDEHDYPKNKDGTDFYYGLDYGQFTPFLTKAIQELDAKVEEHHNRKSLVTGVEYSKIDDYEGLIVSATTNEYRNARPVLTLSNTENDKKCYGVILGKSNSIDNKTNIQKSGDGRMWVVNTDGNLESGDLVTTSVINGYGKKQDDDILRSYTLAKLTQDCDFTERYTPIKRVKQELKDVTYYLQENYVEVADLRTVDKEDIIEREVIRYIKIVKESEDFDGKIITPEISEEKYDALTEEEKKSYTVLHFKSITQYEYDRIPDSEKVNYQETIKKINFTREVYESIKPMPECCGEYTTEVRQELVNVLDEHGQLVWEDSEEMEPVYKIRYLDADGNITDEANAVHKAAFVGCTYHCG
jgi:hypothetical protein